MHARTSHAQAAQNACTYTELKLYQLCLAPCKLARQKCNGIKMAKEDFKENPSFDHSIILSIDTCRRFFLILYNITGHMLFCCHSNQWLMLQMIIYSDTDVRATFRHKKYPVSSQFKFLNNDENGKIAFKNEWVGYFNRSN